MTDYKALCAELLAVIDRHVAITTDGPKFYAVVKKTRTALAQPEPEGVTDEELNELFWRHSCEIGDAGVGVALEDAPALIRDALARWGRCAIEPVPVAERLPGAGDCDANELCWWWCHHYESWQMDHAPAHYRHWLPHHALPIPTP